MKTIVVANVFGFIALVMNFLSTQADTKKKVLIYNGVVNVACVFQYLILGAFTGAISCAIATLRNIVFYLYNNKVPFYVLTIYLFIIFIFNVFFLTDLISVIPIATTMLYGICLYQPNIRVLKIGTIIVDGISTLFDLYNKAYVSMTNCIFSVIGGIIGYIRYSKSEEAKLKRKKKKYSN